MVEFAISSSKSVENFVKLRQFPDAVLAEVAKEDKSHQYKISHLQSSVLFFSEACDYVAVIE